MLNQSTQMQHKLRIDTNGFYWMIYMIYIEIIYIQKQKSSESSIFGIVCGT